tara:strand:+ start:248 stop:736 length:489 start_codon:yes stop_codon:yes gene_type:complete
MVKVVVDDRRGLVQESGSGNMVLDNVPLQLKSSGGSLALKSVSTDKNVAAATTLEYANAIPANSIVVGVKVTCITPAVRAGGPVNLTKIGLDGTDGAFDSGLTVDMKTAGTNAIIGAGPVDTAAGFKFYAAADDALLTFDNAPDGPSPVGVIRLTVYYHELS